MNCRLASATWMSALARRVSRRAAVRPKASPHLPEPSRSLGLSVALEAPPFLPTVQAVQKPLVLIMKEQPSRIDRFLGGHFGKYARVRSFVSLAGFYQALERADRDREEIALLVVTAVLPEFSFLVLLSHLATMATAFGTQVLYIGQDDTLVLQRSHVTRVLSSAPARRTSEILAVVRGSIERFYLATPALAAAQRETPA